MLALNGIEMHLDWAQGPTPAHLVGVHVDPHQEDELGHEEAAAEILMDGRSGALDLAEEPEGEDAHGQTDEGDDHPQLGNPGQDGVVGHQLGGNMGRERVHSYILTLLRWMKMMMTASLIL